MWTSGIFFGIIFAGVGFLLWFLAGLIHEAVSYSRRAERSTAYNPNALGTLLWNQSGAARQGQDKVTVRLVWWLGSARARAKEEPSCGMSSSYF